MNNNYNMAFYLGEQAQEKVQYRYREPLNSDQEFIYYTITVVDWGLCTIL